MEISFENETKHAPMVKVLGIGGGGGNSIDMLIEEGVNGVELIVVDTDKYSLERSNAEVKIQIGGSVTRGMGTGGDPLKGRESAQKDSDRIMKAIEGADILFISSAFGGGTGTGATPVIAELAKKNGILTISFIMMPFEFQGPDAIKKAEMGLSGLRDSVDSLIVVLNSNALNLELTKSPSNVLKDINRVFLNAVVGIRDIILKPAYMKLDLPDVKNSLYGKGRTIIGVGDGEGDQKGEEAVKKALSSPLLEKDSIKGARSIILHVIHGEDTTMEEILRIAEIIRDEAKTEVPLMDVNLKPGFSFDKSFKGKIRTTVIATDFVEEETDDTLSETKDTKDKEPGKENFPLDAEPFQTKFGGEKPNSFPTPTKVTPIEKEEKTPKRRKTSIPPFLDKFMNDKE